MRPRNTSSVARAERLKQRLAGVTTARSSSGKGSTAVRVIGHFVAATTLFRNLVFGAVAIVAAAFIWHEVRDDSVYVEPITVPPSLAQLGVTPDALAALIVDRVGRIVTELGAVPNLLVPETRASRDVREIHVLTIGPSLQVVGRQIRRLFGYSDTRITGIVTQSDRGWRISMRDPSTHLVADAGVLEADSVPGALVEAGAVSLLRITNPQLILQYQYNHFYTARDAATLRQLEQTVDFLEQAAGMRGSREVRDYRGNIALWRGDFATTLEVYSHLALDYPSKGQYQLHAAEAALHLGRFDGASIRLDEFIRSSESDPMLFPMAGELALGLGRWRDALDLVKRARRADPKNENVLWVAGEALNGLHRPRETIALLDGWAMKSLDWFVSQQATLAASYAATNDVVRLREIAGVLTRDFPDSSDTWRVAGRLAELQGNLIEARGWYERLSHEKLQENDSTLVADIMVKEGKVEAAIPRIESYVNAWPWLADGHHSLARALAASGRMVKADTEYAEVIRRDPDNVQALKEWSEVLAKLGQRAEAKLKLAVAKDAEQRLAIPLDISELRQLQASPVAKG